MSCRGVFVVLVLIPVGAILFFAFLGSLVPEDPARKATREERERARVEAAEETQRSADERQEQIDAIVIEKWNWSSGTTGGFMTATFTFKNDNPFPVRDLTVRCRLTAPSGTELDEATKTVYEMVPAKGRKTVRDFTMGFIHNQARQARCKVTAFRKA